ncbi:MAG: TerB family tellurite resistance protein [Saprospiraceae bacterium]|nr:TerB family tellurite resistance protein [Saprospiraceae bacterium]
MEIKGKVICGILGIFLFDLLGIPLGGLIGFFVGSWLGHYLFDQPKEKEQSDSEFRAYQRRQGEFVFHVFRLCAKMAKSDGPINAQEVRHMESLMRHQFRMNERGREQAIRIWKNAKESTDTFEQYARAFYEGFGRDRHHVMNMLDLLFATAAADGTLNPKEEGMLLRAAGIFQIGKLQYERIKARYYQQRGGSPFHQNARWDPLDPHYAILGANPSDSLDDIKKKYRALALQWHPDKVAAKGLSAEAQRHAKEKFQQINEAYERITEARR